MGCLCIRRGKTIKMSFEGKMCRKFSNGQNIDYSGKICPRALYASFTTIIFKHVYWVYLADLR